MVIFVTTITIFKNWALLLDNMNQILNELGLTRLEKKVYKTLLNEGASGVGEISRKTGIHRRNVYDCLERLIKKGLVAYIKENNRKMYSLTNPKNIQEKLKQRVEELEKLMPEWLAKFNSITEKKETLFFRGKEGSRLVFEDQIRVGKEVLVNATTVEVQKILSYYFPKYKLLRKERNIRTRMLFDSTFKTKKNLSKLAELPLCKTRFMKNFNRSPTSHYIYGDNVAIAVWSDVPIAIVIRQKDIAQGFRENFEAMWQIAKA